MITKNIKKTEKEKLMMGGTWPSPSPQFFTKLKKKNDARKRTTTSFSTPSLTPHFFYKTKKKNIDPRKSSSAPPLGCNKFFARSLTA
jgi:hypothetical protein